MSEIVLSDSTREAMLDAIDLYGVYGYFAYSNVEGVMFVVMLNTRAMVNCGAEQYLSDKCPEWRWVLIAKGWLNWDNMEAEPVFNGGDWCV